MKKLFCCPALELFHCLPPLFHFLPLWTTVRLHGKKLQNATKDFHPLSAKSPLEDGNSDQKISHQHIRQIARFEKVKFE